jgi:hypothetical protein
MQLRLETDELNLLADLLMERMSAAPHGHESYDNLLEMVLARDLRFDSGELEQLADLLAGQKQSLREEVAHQSDAARKSELQRKMALLERVLERVDEACVMF